LLFEPALIILLKQGIFPDIIYIIKERLMITKLKLKNFRCFNEFMLEGIRHITLIAGGNGD
jgi:hypothetical protein